MPSEIVSRRSIIKLMALASSALCEPKVLFPEKASLPSAMEHTDEQRLLPHPRLFYNSASLNRTKEFLATNPQVDAALRARGQQLLTAALIPETFAKIGGGQQANYRAPSEQIVEMGLTLGLLFHLTGDKRYAEKLRAALLYYVQYERWAGPELIHRVPPWHSELDTATFSFGYAAGYDAVHEFLSGADRKAITDGLIRLGALPILEDWILPDRRIHSFDSMGHNWWGVCVSGAGLCALAMLGDDPRAQGWVDAVDAGYAQWFNYRGDVLQNRVATFERSGPSYEGVWYTNYGVNAYLHYRFAWQNTFPRRKAIHVEPLAGLASFYLHTLYPASEGFYSVNFNDAVIQADCTETILLLAACGLGTPDAARYLRHLQTHPEGTLLSILRQYPQPEGAGEVSTSAIYPHMGWATMRSSWQNNSTLLAMKSGFTWNHAHADAGSFMIFHKGNPLIIDSGTCKYSHSEYTTYYRLSQAHNVILYNNEGQPKSDLGLGCKFPGQMHSLIDGLGLKYVYADATGPMARWFLRNYRHWIWSGDVILILDDVWAHEAGQLDWLLHYAGNYTYLPNGGIRLTNGAAEAVVKVAYPTCQRREEIGLADHDPDKKIPYLVFRPNSSAQSSQFITAICLNPDDVPVIEVTKQPTYLGVRLETRGSTEETYVSLRSIETPGTVSVDIGEFSTDAYLVHFKRQSRNAPIDRYFIGEGSYLRNSKRALFESLSKGTACWAPGESLQIYSNELSPIQIGVEREPRNISWNGKPITGLYNQQTQLLSVGEHSE